VKYLSDLERYEGYIYDGLKVELDKEFPVLSCSKSAHISIPFVDRLFNKVMKHIGVNAYRYNNYGMIFADDIVCNDFFIPNHGDYNEFIFAHLMDCHESIFSGKNFQFDMDDFVTSYRFDNEYEYYYEKSIISVDQKLGPYLDRILEKNDDVVISVISDHGSYHGHPNRGKVGRNPYNYIYSDSLNSVMMFYAKGIESKRDHKLCSLIDFSPSLLDLLNMDAHSSFNGSSIFSDNNKTVVSETCGSGPCHLQTKPIYLSVTTDEYRLIYREFIPHGNAERKLVELYRIDDYTEENDLSNVESFSEIVADLVIVAKDRINEVRASTSPEIS